MDTGQWAQLAVGRTDMCLHVGHGIAHNQDTSKVPVVAWNGMLPTTARRSGRSHMFGNRLRISGRSKCWL